MKHKQNQCLKCNFEKTCNGLSFHERNFTDCDVIEIEAYERLLSSKKMDLQAKVNAAIAEACDEIRTIQSQMNELIQTDPRVSFEVLYAQIRTKQVFPSNALHSTTVRRENLAFFGIYPRPIWAISASIENSSPRLCRLLRESYSSAWGFSALTKDSRQYVGKVDCGGPAERAGIQKNDEILEINNISVTGLTHKEIVGIVKKLNSLNLNLLVKKT